MTKQRTIKAGALLAGTLLIAAGAGFAAPPPIVFSKQVLPLLNRECRGCHSGSSAGGGYSLESAERLLGGGRHGKAVLAGKGGESVLVKYLTGELKPQMPPNKPLPLDSVALVRRWIDEGAKIDSMIAPATPERAGIMRDAMPMRGKTPLAGVDNGPHAALLPSAVTQSAPVTAVAFSPDGKWVAAGGYRAVRILDAESGAVLQTLAGPVDQVLSVAWSADGKRLAGAGGLSGAYGEVCLWDAPAPGAAWPKPRILKDHTDAIYGVAWRPGSAEFATAGLDKTARLWDAGAGTVSKVLKDHVDSVFAVAYSPDGKWLATGSMDRTVKLYDAATRARVNSFINPEGVTALGFGAKGDILAVACDRQLRVWPVKTGSVENPLRGHGEGEQITSDAFSADGRHFTWGAVNRKVRLLSGDAGQMNREMGSEITDWVYGVSLSPDGKRIAAGTGEGKVFFWNTADGKLERAVSLGAGASIAAAAEVKR